LVLKDKIDSIIIVYPKYIIMNSSNPELTEQIMQEEYIHSLNPYEKKAYEIAKMHLGSSFHLIKSIGFIEWKTRLSNEKKVGPS